MGAQSSLLSQLEFNTSLEIQSGIETSSIWSKICQGKYQQSDVTVFIGDSDNLNEQTSKDFSSFYSCIKYLKQLKHPGILRYLASSNDEVQAVIVAEKLCLPLAVIQNVTNHYELEPIEVVDGLHSITVALKFLHEQARLSHNSISVSAIYGCDDGTWKLADFQHTTTCIPSSITKDWKDISLVIDSLDHFLDKFEVPFIVERIRNFNKLLRSAQDDQSVQVLIENVASVFRTDLSEIVEYLLQLPSKSSIEKLDFFKTLSKRLCVLPSAVVARRLIKLLLSRFVILESAAQRYLLPNLLLPLISESECIKDSGKSLNALSHQSNAILPLPLYRKYLVPELLKIFFVHEQSVRLALLSNFDRYCAHIDERILKQIVLPELLLGMKDECEEVVAASIRSMSCLVPILGPSQVTGLQHSKYFTEGRPRERADILNELLQHSTVRQVLEDEKLLKRSSERKNQRRMAMQERRQQMLSKRQERHSSADFAISIPVDQVNNLINGDIDQVAPFIEAPIENSVLNDVCELATVNNSTENSATNEILTGECVEKSEDEWTDWEEEDTKVEPIDNVGATAVEVHDESSKLNATISLKFVSHSTDKPLQPNGDILRTNPRYLDRKQRTNSDELGKEFDVKQIDVLARQIERNSIEDDLFNDLLPRFTPARTLSPTLNTFTSDSNDSNSRFCSKNLSIADVDQQAEGDWYAEENYVPQPNTVA